MRLDFSVVIPTLGRETYVQRLLGSLSAAREQYNNQVEVIIVDSSDEISACQIEDYCKMHNAVYYQGEQSVRWKRNYGVSKASYPIIMFIDSDCEVDVNIFSEHARIYESGIDRLGGVYGLTKFFGRRSFLWRIIELTSFVDVFSFAERYPYVQWGIGNNISFYKSVFNEVGAFDESFPFRLGGDDLDLSLRVTTAGYWLKTNAQAIVYHTRDTWNSWSAFLERAIRWGRMEYYIGCKYPQLMKRDLPRQESMFLIFALVSLVAAIPAKSSLPLTGLLLWGLISYLLDYLWAQFTGEKKPFVYYTLARILAIMYQVGSLTEYLRHRRLEILYKRMIFSVYHIRSIWAEEVRRLWVSLISFWIVLLVYALLLK